MSGHNTPHNQNNNIVLIKMDKYPKKVGMEEPKAQDSVSMEDLLMISRINKPKEKAAQLEDDHQISTITELMKLYRHIVQNRRMAGRIIPRVDDFLELELEFSREILDT